MEYFEEEDEDDGRMDNKDGKLSVLFDKLEPEQIKSFVEKFRQYYIKGGAKMKEFQKFFVPLHTKVCEVAIAQPLMQASWLSLNRTFANVEQKTERL